MLISDSGPVMQTPGRCFSAHRRSHTHARSQGSRDSQCAYAGSPGDAQQTLLDASRHLFHFIPEKPRNPLNVADPDELLHVSDSGPPSMAGS